MQIRYYSKSQLAQVYFSHMNKNVARIKLMRWIKRCQPLCEELQKANYTTNNRGFTPKQVRLINDYLGEPNSISD